LCEIYFIPYSFIQHIEPGVVVHVCNPSTWKAEAGGLKVKAGLGSIVKPYLKKKHKQKPKKYLFSIFHMSGIV
jgi:hypothetical protein